MATEEAPLWGEDEVAEEELRLLEAMAAVSTSMQQVRGPGAELRRKWRGTDGGASSSTRCSPGSTSRPWTCPGSSRRPSGSWCVSVQCRFAATRRANGGGVGGLEQNALYLPFQAAIYEMQGERRKTQGTPAPPSRRTEL